MNYIKYVCNNDADKIFNMFNDSLYIPSDKTGKMTHTYIDVEQAHIVTDYLGNSEVEYAKSGVHLGACDFTLSISKQYLDFLTKLKQGYIFTGLKMI